MFAGYDRNDSDSKTLGASSKIERPANPSRKFERIIRFTGAAAIYAACALSLTLPCKANLPVSNPVTGLINVTDNLLNAKPDMLIFSDGAITSGSKAFTSSSATFVSGDVGKSVVVVGAGSSGATLTATITTYTSAHAVTLSTAASTTVSGAQYTYGTDNTAAFVNGMAQIMSGSGTSNFTSDSAPVGVINIPAGAYLIISPLNIPNFTRLHGSMDVPSNLNGALGNNQDPGVGPLNGGVTLGFTEGFGSATATPYITLNSNSEVDGLTIMDPLQTNSLSATSPNPAPYAVNMNGQADRISSVNLLNVYQGIYAAGTRHWIDHITGQPTAMGICIPSGADIDHISDVHFVPQFNNISPGGIWQWQQNNGVAFDLVHDDQLRVTNCFCLGYNIGFEIGSSTDSGFYGKLIGCGADLTENPLVAWGSNGGTTFTDCDFYGLNDNTNHRCVYTESGFTGRLSFVNCSFNNVAGSVACLVGSTGALVNFNSCQFLAWDLGEGAPGEACIQSDGPMVHVNNCDFRFPVSQSAPTSPCEFYANSTVLAFMATDNIIVGGTASIQSGSSPINVATNGATWDSNDNVSVPYSSLPH